MNPIILILASVVLGVVGQLVLKLALNRGGQLNLAGDGPAAVAWRIGTNPLIWSGLALYAIGTLFWLAALSRVDLGYAYPFISLSYVLVLVSAWAIFRETISWWRIAGVAAICLGVVVAAAG